MQSNSHRPNFLAVFMCICRVMCTRFLKALIIIKTSQNFLLVSNTHLNITKAAQFTYLYKVNFSLIK